MAMANTSPFAGRLPLIDLYIRMMDSVSRYAAYLAAVMFIAGVFAVCHMVFVRYVLGMSTSWQTEFTVFSVTGAMLMGSATC